MTPQKEQDGNSLPMEFKFNSAERPIRFQFFNEQPWAIAKDVCDALLIQNSRQAVAVLDDDEKLAYKIHTSGQNRNTWMINESGIYSLIFRSNKPEARLFRKWVTNEVLPAIRKNGYFDPHYKLDDPEQIAVADLVIKAIRIAGKQSVLARYLGVSESVLCEIRTRPGKITRQLCMKVAEDCKEIIRTGELPEHKLRSLDIMELNQMWFDIALIESYEIRKRISQRMKKIMGRSGVNRISKLSQEGGQV